MNMDETTAEVVASLAVIIGLVLLRWLILHYVHRRIEDPDVWFRAKRIATYSFTFVAIVSLAWIWIDAFDALPTYLGLVSAGVAIALADLLKNMAGWLYILVRRPLRIGDRIQIGDFAGDVVDVRLFRFSMVEIGNWVDADQSTGRLIHVPNGMVFTTPVANYTEEFEHIWHEIPVLITFESNWQKARAIFLEEIEAASSLDATSREVIRKAAREYQIKVGKLTPIVYLTVRDSGVLLTGRLLTSARERRLKDDKVWSRLLVRFAEEGDISLAYPTVRTFFEGPVTIDGSSSGMPGPDSSDAGS
jgi:small-conductance mechanosensitive channel